MKKIHTTNYENTLILISDDCPALQGKIPPLNKGGKTIAGRQFEILAGSPYKYTSDDVLFMIFAERNDLLPGELDESRMAFFSKGQACFRASPLPRRYGWGIHANAEGRIALVSANSPEYNSIAADAGITKVKAMRTIRMKG